MTRTVMIMAGGTGGHIYPGMAVADVLRKRGWQVVWLGTRKGMESRIVPGAGYAMAWLSMGGLRGNGLIRKLVMPGMLLLACVQALVALLRHRPDVVLGFGGYPSFPGGIMAVVTGLPLLVHEQNAVAGLSNRVLACLAKRVMTGFPEAFRQAIDRPLPCGKVHSQWTGNPVRASLVPAIQARKERSGRLRLLVVGGSLGAQALNDVVPRALALIGETERPQVIHQSGERHLETLRRNYQDAAVEAEVKDYIQDMADVYAWCDVAITRAGALTVAELAAAGVPAILVPYPHAVDDHQTRNAGFLVSHGAAILMRQEQLTPNALAELLAGLGRGQLTDMAERALSVAKPDAATTVADVCEDMVR